MTARRSGRSGRERLAVIFGGRSTEHEVSVTSARSIMREADRERFEVIPFGVTRNGKWLTPAESLERLERVEAGESRGIGDDMGTGVLAYADVLQELRGVDAAFPIIHGTFGEDGTLQGMLELADVPYVGPGVAASAVGMDKALMRDVFAAHGIPQAEYLVLRDREVTHPTEEILLAIDELGYPCFVKPANGGSSVGVSKVRSREDVAEAIYEAAHHDRKVVVERGLEGQEVECAVLGNYDPQPSPLGEIRPRRDFYDYQAKYLDDSTDLIVPAEVSEETARRVQDLAVRAFVAMNCAGMSRVDFFVLRDGDVRCIEVNTLPGFTPISMYPRLWQEAGLTYTQLISRLVDLALERYAEVRSHA
jgi:D-alanine-D-alanine ligase